MKRAEISNQKPHAFLLAGAALPAEKLTALAQVRLRSSPSCDVTHSDTWLTIIQGKSSSLFGLLLQ